MDSTYVHDKAKYHYDSVRENGLSLDHAANHTVVFLRWLIERGMMSDFFKEEGADVLRRFRAGSATIHQVYDWWDCCLIADMLSDEGNGFALHYYDFTHGQYVDDYTDTLDPRCPTVFHIGYTEDGYQRVGQVIDRRYDEWKKSKHLLRVPPVGPTA